MLPAAIRRRLINVGDPTEARHVHSRAAAEKYGDGRASDHAAFNKKQIWSKRGYPAVTNSMLGNSRPL